MKYKKLMPSDYIKSKKNKCSYIKKQEKERAKLVSKVIKRIHIKITKEPMSKAISSYRKITFDIRTEEEILKLNQPFLDRILTNYIRHEYTNYMNVVKESSFMLKEEKSILKQKVNDKILRIYKDLI